MAGNRGAARDAVLNVKVTVGVGAWTATTTVKLVACPHVGDSVIVGEDVVACDRVRIGWDLVEVFDKSRFSSEKDAQDQQRKWDKA